MPIKWVQLDYLSWRHPTVSVWVQWCDLSPSWVGFRVFFLLGQCFFCTFTRACCSNGSTGLRAGCPSQLHQQIQCSPQHTECARMGPWGSAWFAPCLFDTVWERTPVFGPFSVDTSQTGVVKCSCSQSTYAKSIALFLGAKWQSYCCQHCLLICKISSGLKMKI